MSELALVLLVVLLVLFLGGFWVAKTVLWALAVVALVALVASVLTGRTL